MLDSKEVTTAFLRKLKASGLNAEDAQLLDFQAFTGEQVAKRPSLVGLTTRPAAGFVLPYSDVEGNYADFYRFRYLEEPPKNGFAALTNAKPTRYIQPTAARPRVYFPKSLPWKKIFAGPAEERWIYITEGELKAAAACKLGLPTIALGGVWNFMSKREGVALIPDLAALPLEGSTVYIVYDSDAVNNPDVLMAENALARQLTNMGAIVMVVRLPALKNQPKTGLDDYLVAKGAKAFDKLVEAVAEEWAASAALHEMNEEVLFLREGATVMEPRTRNRWRASDYVNAVAVNKTFMATDFKKKEPVMVEKRTAAEWIKWPGRAQLERMTYRPGAPTVIENEYNAWQGWGLPVELIKKGDVKPWKELLDFIFRGHKLEHRAWFEQWIAYPIQHPGTKLFTATLLWGLPGTGKTLVGHTMSRIYGANYTEVNERELHASFNEWAECRQFALGDEITGGDKRGVADYLKGVITQKFLRINPKHIKPYVVPDCINWLFTSNHCDAFFVEDDDRRYFIVEVKGRPMERTFYRAYDAWYRSNEGAGALFQYLLNLDLTGFDPMDAAPITSSKSEMISDVRSDLGTWCAALRDNPDEVLRIKGGGPIVRQLWTTTELYALFDPEGTKRVTANGLARELKRIGFRKALDGAPLRTSQGLVKLWIIRNVDTLVRMSKPIQFASLYDTELGTIKKPSKF